MSSLDRLISQLDENVCSLCKGVQEKDREQVTALRLKVEECRDKYQAAFCSIMGFTDGIAAENEYEETVERCLEYWDSL